MDNIFLVIVSFGVVLVPLIFIHELGHFIMAKMVGITVLEFGIGFPPRITVLFKRGTTEYTLNWLPLGGFVLPLGESMVSPLPDEEVEQQRKRVETSTGEVVEIENPVAVNDVSPGRRILFMLGGPLFNVVAAMLLFAAAGLVGIPAIDHTDITVASLSWASPLLGAGVRPGDRIRALDGEPVDFAEDVLDYLNAHADDAITLTVERAGKTLEITLPAGAWAGADGVLATRLIDGGDVKVLEVNPDSPAERAGLQADDIVLAGMAETPYPAASLGIAQIGEDENAHTQSLDAHSVYNHADLSRFIRAATGSPVTLTVLRDGVPRHVTIITRANPPPGQGATGITISTDYPITIERETLLPSLVQGVKATVNVTLRVIEAPILILRGDIGGEMARPLSIVGISQLGGQFIQESVDVQTPAPALEFAALISVALGITNLLPLPALDGGRILFTLIELVRGKRMDPSREGLIHMIGLVTFMALMILMIVADIIDPVQLP